MSTAEAPFHFRTAIASQFRLEIGTTTVERVMSVSGLAISFEVAPALTGEDRWERKRPGLLKVEDITFKRNFFHDDTTMSEYWKNWIEHTGAPEDGAIIMYNNASSGNLEEVARWNFFSAFAIKYAISDFDSSSNDLVTEELTLSIERLEREMG